MLSVSGILLIRPRPVQTFMNIWPRGGEGVILLLSTMVFLIALVALVATALPLGAEIRRTAKAARSLSAAIDRRLPPVIEQAEHLSRDVGRLSELVSVVGPATEGLREVGDAGRRLMRLKGMLDMLQGVRRMFSSPTAGILNVAVKFILSRR